MNKIKFITMVLLVFFSGITLFSQNNPADTADTPVITNDTVKAENDKKPENEPAKNNLPPGYGDVKWGSDFETVKAGVKGKLAFTDENKTIISKEGEITYYYGFFFRDPEKVGENKDAEAKAEYYFSSVEFPYSGLEMIKNKMIDKYGEPARENVKNNRGAYLWESDTTIIIVWVDAYENKPYVRKISYISRNVSEKIKQYFYDIFNQDKINVDKVLIP
ncbi:MAG: hypothetical protein JW982_06465 [Spirochaetes bacterium]|nr:hypothetical protein [Spirochaetota bacterium]